MTRALTTVQRAARRRTEAHDAYRDAVLAARAAGHTLAEIGAAAGIARQNVHKLLRRHGPDPGVRFPQRNTNPEEG